jgi:hypothetical protein
VREAEGEVKSESLLIIHTKLTAKQVKKKDKKIRHWKEIAHIEPEVIIEDKTS